MKKQLLFCAVTVLALTACDNEPKLDSKPLLSGNTYVLCQGNYYQNIEGELFALDLDAGTASDNVFQRANGRNIGATPQCGIVYGSKMYVGVKESHTIEVLDKNTFVSLKQILLIDESKGVQPESMVSDGKYVYVAMFDGYVARLDTTTLAIDASVKVGPNPEEICLYNNKIYVPNSDGMNWQEGYGTTASVISLPKFEVTETFEVPVNPRKFMVANGELYLFSGGNYGDVLGAVYKIGADRKATSICPATMATSCRDEIVIANTPFGETVTVEFYRYNAKTDKLTTWAPEQIDYPSGLGMRYDGYIFVSSYVMNGQYPAYDAPGYVNQYSSDGEFMRRYDIGSGPTCIFF